MFKKMMLAWKVFKGDMTAIPAKFETNDIVTGKRLRISTSERYTRIAFGPREYFFNRDGSFDGTGFAFCGDGVAEDNEKAVVL